MGKNNNKFVAHFFLITRLLTNHVHSAVQRLLTFWYLFKLSQWRNEGQG